MTRTRLVIVQGPVQAMVACAAIGHLEQARHDVGYRNVMLFGGILADDESTHYTIVREASFVCANGVDWDLILEFGDVPDRDSMRAAVGGDVAQIICGRNWGYRLKGRPSIEEVVLTAFQDTHRVVVGDALGAINMDPDGPQFHLALPLIPEPRNTTSFDGLELDVVPRDRLLDVISAVRAGAPEIARLDASLALFAQDGMLVLMNYLSEAYQASLKGEIDLTYDAIRAGGLDPGAAVVIKPHPRASLGQSAALARRLRAEGHRVRIIGQFEGGCYPIELFSELARAVERVCAPQSSSLLSLRYLYGVEGTAGLPPNAKRRLLPRDRRLHLTGSKWMVELLDHFAEWDGRSALPVPPPAAPTRFSERVRGRIARPKTWGTRAPWRRRVDTWKLPRLNRGLLSSVGAEDSQSVMDDLAGVVWLIGEPHRNSQQSLRLEDVTAPEERVRRVLGSLSEAQGARFGVLVATLPSSFAPGWQRWWRNLAGVKVNERAALSAEQFEDLLETQVDVIARLPEVGIGITQALRWRFLALLRRAVPPGYVLFACRVRPLDDPAAHAPLARVAAATDGSSIMRSAP